MKILVITAIFLISIMMQVAFGACTIEQAKKSVEAVCKIVENPKLDVNAKKKAIKKYSYCDGNYVWVQEAMKNKKIIIVMHPIKWKQLNGKDMAAVKDKKGKLMFLAFDKEAKKSPKGGTVDYYWTKPGAETATPKVSFVKKCGGKLNWIAGSGVWK